MSFSRAFSIPESRVEKSKGSSIPEVSSADAASFSRSALPFFFRRMGFEEKFLQINVKGAGLEEQVVGIRRLLEMLIYTQLNVLLDHIR